MPDDLPWMIEWRMQFCILSSLPRKPVESISASGVTNSNIVRPNIPHGCYGWRRAGETEWKSLKDLPKEWLPFLNRGIARR